MALESLPKISPANFSPDNDLIQVYSKKGDYVGVINPSYIKTSPSGVAGAIQFSDGSAFASSSNLTWNNATNALGLGSGTTSAFIDFASNPAGSTTIVGAVRTYRDGVNLSEVMTFREDGNIGINTSSPTEALTISGNINFIGSNRTIASSSTPLNAIYSDSLLTCRFIRDSGGQGILFTDTGGSAYAKMGFGNLNTTIGQSSVGVVPDLGARLGVRGSGSTSATTSLLVQNSGGTQSLRISDDGTINTSYTAPVNINFLLNVMYDITARTLGGNSGALGLIGQSQGNASATMVNIATAGSPAGTIGTSLQISAFPLQGATHIGVTYNGNYTSSLGVNTLIGYDFSPTNYGGSTLRAFQSSVGGAYINTTSYNASAILQADSTTKGFLPPRMTDAQIRAIVSPANGLVAYNTDINHLCCYQNGAWAKFSHSPM